ncbi:hypothetical protein GCM10017667_70150 [Streptomyces filamentosus]|uniref:Uncharacterized protein n=1 Tax=Streptomyces filamentosus TaxID=67294 RepID=A0A919BY34_STRFL|nr:hypothetical protein [Streptomyces filamentosus]GHG24422.1 hypothetical protein GCM10017667_70150 [Streptomyces filamentosus]
MEALEAEADGTAVGGGPAGAQGRRLGAVDPHGAGVGAFDGADQMQRGGRAPPRTAGEGDDMPGGDREADAVGRRDDCRALAEGPGESGDLDGGARRSRRPVRSGERRDFLSGSAEVRC